MSFSWKCPFCNQNATITDSDCIADHNYLNIENSIGRRCIGYLFIVCPNEDCKKYEFRQPLMVYPFCPVRRIGIGVKTRRFMFLVNIGAEF